MWRRHLLPALLGFLIIAGLVGLRLADPYPVRVARDIAFDVLQQLAPRAKSDLPVRVVDIDEESLRRIGQWPWPRSELATLTRRLGELGAAAIAFDVLFPEPDRLSPSRLAMTPLAWARLTPGPDLPDNDALFADALRSTPSVLGFAVSTATKTLPTAPKSGFAISGTDPTGAIPQVSGAVLPIAQLGDAAAGLGALSLQSNDSGSIVRELPLVWSAGNQLYPALAAEALRVALGAQTIVVFGDTAGQGYVDGVRIGDFTIPTDASGNLVLYYTRPDPALFVSARDILGPDYREMEPLIKGEIVLIGTSASGLLDLHTTALGDSVPGVSIHAQALQQILSGTYLTRSDWVSGLEIASFVLIGILVVAFLLRVGPLAALLIGLGLLVALAGTSWVLFTRYGLLLDPSFPLFGTFVLYSAMVFLRFAITDGERRQIRRAFAHYVAPALLTRIERSGDTLKLGGEVRDLTVMFADVRGFTPISEAMAPEELLTMLNTLFGALGAEVVAQYGTIDKFIGDALMAFWNAPVDVADHPRKACLAALGMRARLRALNAADGFGRKAAGRNPAELQIGVGISTGPALVGNMGLESRFDYSCLGDTVNVASRVEGACKMVGYDIVVVEETRERAGDLAFLEAGSLRLKGKSAREPIHLLVGDAVMAQSAAFAALAEAHQLALAAIRAGSGGEAAIARCAELAQAVDAGLSRFYDLIRERTADFAEALTPAA
ncbi:MAG TPA: adenylate/guanylate cyclase domain-containing protein [Devosiaceae bacterium]|jgi:adenylate cyclase|nr:adenylate/guanylate cyclase domain-containing protein [Devosiaceae bacterium]